MLCYIASASDSRAVHSDAKRLIGPLPARSNNGGEDRGKGKGKMENAEQALVYRLGYIHAWFLPRFYILRVYILAKL